MIGEGKYNLNAVEEILVTESFLGLDESVKDCQNKEELNECKNKHMERTLLEQCGCVPLSIRISKKVSIVLEFQTTHTIFCNGWEEHTLIHSQI